MPHTPPQSRVLSYYTMNRLQVQPYVAVLSLLWPQSPLAFSGDCSAFVALWTKSRSDVQGWLPVVVLRVVLLTGELLG